MWQNYTLVTEKKTKQKNFQNRCVEILFFTLEETKSHVISSLSSENVASDEERKETLWKFSKRKGTQSF